MTTSGSRPPSHTILIRHSPTHQPSGFKYHRTRTLIRHRIPTSLNRTFRLDSRWWDPLVIGTPNLKGVKAPNSSSEQPISKVIVKLVRSFLLRLGTCREVPGLSACHILVFSQSDERLYDSWNARPSCVLTRLSLLLFSLRLVSFPRFLILRMTKLVLYPSLPYPLDKPSLFDSTILCFCLHAVSWPFLRSLIYTVYAPYEAYLPPPLTRISPSIFSVRLPGFLNPLLESYMWIMMTKNKNGEPVLGLTF